MRRALTLNDVSVCNGPDGRWWLESPPRPRLSIEESVPVVPVGWPASHIAWAGRHLSGDRPLHVEAFPVEDVAPSFVHDEEAWLLLLPCDHLERVETITIIDGEARVVATVPVPRSVGVPGPRDGEGWHAYAPDPEPQLNG